MSFDANVIKRQYGERPWHHFRIKPNDTAYDSSAGLQDILDSGERVPLPPGHFYCKNLHNTGGGKLIGASAFHRVRTTTPDDNTKQTILRYNGAGTSTDYMLNVGEHATLNTDTSASDVEDHFFENITFDCNGNSINSGTGARNSDGASICPVGVFLRRCGNQPDIGRNFTVIGASEVGVRMLGVYSSALHDFQIAECTNRSIDVGYNHYAFVTEKADAICHDLALKRFDIRNCGSVTQTWAATAAAYRHNAAYIVLGRGVEVSNFSYQINAGPMVFSGNSVTAVRGSEGASVHHGYFEKNTGGSFAVTSEPNAAYAMFLALGELDINFEFHHLFFNTGNSSNPTVSTNNIIAIYNAPFTSGYVEDTWPGADSTYGVAEPSQWPYFHHIGSAEFAANDAPVGLLSQTRRFRAPPESNRLKYTVGASSGLSPLGDKTVLRQGPSLTIATGAITVTNSYHKVDTEAAAASDDLDTINGGEDGMVLRIVAVNNTRSIVIKDGTGNIYCDGSVDITLDDSREYVDLFYDGEQSFWYAVGYNMT